MVSFCSDELQRSKRKRANPALAKFGLCEDVCEEDDEDDESLAGHLKQVAGGEPEVALDGSPIKRNLRNPGLSINKIISRAKSDAREVVMISRNAPATADGASDTSKCMFKIHKVELLSEARPAPTTIAAPARPKRLYEST